MDADVINLDSRNMDAAHNHSLSYTLSNTYVAPV